MTFFTISSNLKLIKIKKKWQHKTNQIFREKNSKQQNKGSV